MGSIIPRIQSGFQLGHHFIPQGEGNMVQWLDHWGHRGVHFGVVNEGGEAAQAIKQRRLLSLLGESNLYDLRAAVVGQRETEPHEEVEAQEVGPLARDVEREFDRDLVP